MRQINTRERIPVAHMVNHVAKRVFYVSYGLFTCSNILLFISNSESNYRKHDLLQLSQQITINIGNSRLSRETLFEGKEAYCLCCATFNWKESKLDRAECNTLLI